MFFTPQTIAVPRRILLFQGPIASGLDSFPGAGRFSWTDVKTMSQKTGHIWEPGSRSAGVIRSISEVILKFWQAIERHNRALIVCDALNGLVKDSLRSTGSGILFAARSRYGALSCPGPRHDAVLDVIPGTEDASGFCLVLRA